MKKLYVFMLSVIAVLVANAEPVSRSEALQKARQFMPGKQFNANQASSRSKRVMADKEPFYIFNAEEGGFVVISGDDRTVPVIGYSEKGQLLQDDMPDNLRNWLDGYAEQLQAIENGEATPVLSRSLSGVNAVGPLIQTQWNQDEPYNLMTPTYIVQDQYGNEYTKHFVTGCVATALAQVMYFHRWPESCPTILSYTTKSRGIYMPALEATTEAPTFEWNKMKATYAPSETGEAAQAVAKLMLYVGQANEMNYNTKTYGGSSAYIIEHVMADIFGYSRYMHTVNRDDFTTADWENIIYQELKANRPVLYDGSSNSGGHQFICDGYDGNGLFHINWGWGGVSDAYFVLAIANPPRKGAGGGSGNTGYIYRQSALIGFQPAGENEPEVPSVYSAVTTNFNDATYNRASLTENFTGVSTSGTYFYGVYDYVPTTTYPIEVAWALWQNGRIIDVATPTKNYTVNNTNLEPYHYYMPIGANPISFGANVSDGSYRLVQAWRPQGSTGDWTVMATGANALLAVISGNELSVRAPDKNTVTFTVTDVSYSGSMSQGEDITATISMTNTSDVSQQEVYLWMEVDGAWTNIGRGDACLDPGESGQAAIKFSSSNAGTFNIRITPDNDVNNVMGTSTVTIFQVMMAEIDGIVYSYTEGSDYADIVGANSEYFNLDAQYANYLLDLVIPGSITISDKTYKVRKIQDYVFYQYRFKTITIEHGLEEIGNGSFYNCFIWGGYESKAAIVIPESVKTIGDEAFGYIYGLDGLEISLTLPSSLTSIGNNAFGGWTSESLTTVNCRAIRNPFAISANVFQAENGSFTTAKLIIPKDNSKVVEGRYQATAGWQQFFGGTNTIEELAGRCDANSDGSVSVTDIAVVVNSILSIENGGDFDGFGADANGDGGITVTDIGVIVDTILGTGGTNNARRMTRDAVEPQ